MSFFKSFVFVCLMGSSFFANATSYTVDLINESQTSDLIVLPDPIHNPGITFNDTWDLNVAAGTEVTLTFAPVNLEAIPGTGIFLLHIDNFLIDNDGSLVTTFIASTIIDVEGFADGAFGGAYTVVSSVSAVPVPAAAWLFGSALIGLVSFSRRKA